MKKTEERIIGVSHKAATLIFPESGPVNILREETCLPVLIIQEPALSNNIRWMQQYAQQCQVSLAPHGKTSMTPALFRRQLAGGAWGIGVGSAFQAKVAVEAGVSNVIMANQLIGRGNMQLVAELQKSASVHFFCCVDHPDNARQLSTFFAERGQTLRVLLELGVPGGRCGCRTEEEAYALAQLITTLPGLSLAGVEFYEGVIHSGEEQKDIVLIDSFIQRVIGTTRTLIAENMFAGLEEILLTGAGTVWYDIVCQKMQQADLPGKVRYVIRPGCYITHDQGVYQQAQQALRERAVLAAELEGDLQPAMQLLAYVQSLPEPGLAVVGFGKRDVAFDSGLPQPIAQVRGGRFLPWREEQMQTVNLMDQHAMLTYAGSVDLQIGDILVFGTSHPCITFDKWRSIYLVDADYNVLEEMKTAF